MLPMVARLPWWGEQAFGAEAVGDGTEVRDGRRVVRLVFESRLESALHSPCGDSGTCSALAPFSRLAPLASRGYGALRVHDTNRGILVCSVEDRLRMLIAHDGQSLALDYAEADELARCVAEACRDNLCLSIAALLRGEVPLHCAGVEVAGRQVAIMATSGGGKTTLLWHLLDHGAKLVCDDVLVLTHGGQGPGDGDRRALCGTPTVGQPAKLPEEAIRERDLDWAAARRAFPDQDEWWVPVPDALRATEPTPLAALFVLQPHTGPEPPGAWSWARLVGGEALRVLCDNTQGLWAVHSLVDGKRLLGQYRELLAQAPLYALRYHKRREMIPVLGRAIGELTGRESQGARRESRERRSLFSRRREKRAGGIEVRS